MNHIVTQQIVEKSLAIIHATCNTSFQDEIQNIHTATRR